MNEQARSGGEESAAGPGPRRSRGRCATLGATGLALLVAAGCGEKGPPLPPEPRGPLPTSAVRARQIGGEVHVGFTVPKARDEREPQQPVRAEVVRVSYPPHVATSIDPDAFRRRGVVVDTLEADPLHEGDRLDARDAALGELGAAPWGTSLRYGVRLRDRRGRPSPLVVSEELVLSEPTAAPRNLRGEPTADGIRLAWEPPEGPGTFRYNVYRTAGEPSALDDPTNPRPLEDAEYLDATVQLGQTYTYRVRVALAQDAPYRESGDSNAVTLLAEDRFAPGAPQALVAVQEGTAVRLFWNPNSERDVGGYRVYRRREGTAAGAEWERIGPDPVERPLYLDEGVRIGDRPSYRVTAVDRAEPRNESPPSDPVEIEIVAEPTALPEGS